MKKKSSNREEEKKREKINIWVLTIAAIIMVIWLIYRSLEGVSSGYDWYPGGWFYER